MTHAESGLKTCANCNIEKPVTDFNTRGFSKLGVQCYRSFCKECHYLDRRGKLNPEARALYKVSKKTRAEEYRFLDRQSDSRKSKIKNSYLKHHYGITFEEYQTMLNTQNHKCYICNESKKLCVDHDHETGFIRKLLCDRCNKTLGLLKENIDIMIKMIDYIKQHKTCGSCNVPCGNEWCVTNGTKK